MAVPDTRSVALVLMALTPQEKAAGRLFRDECQTQLLAVFDAHPPTYAVPNFLAAYRHPCPARLGRSTALTLREVYVYSPADTERGVPQGRFGFISRTGTCRACNQTAASRAGRLVDAYERPPINAARIIRPIDLVGLYEEGNAHGDPQGQGRDHRR